MIEAIMGPEINLRALLCLWELAGFHFSLVELVTRYIELEVCGNG